VSIGLSLLNEDIMIKIRRKKKAAEPAPEEHACKECPMPESDAFFAGAFPGKPWKRITDTKYSRGFALKVLNGEEQTEAVKLAVQYFGYTGGDFPQARLCIQRELDDPASDRRGDFFKAAPFLHKRLILRAYLSDADGRFITSASALELLKNIAQIGLDFEVGAIDHYIDGKRKTEIVVGDGTEVVSDKGYWFSHTHPAKSGVTNNVLPSTADLDVMISTARSYAHHLEKYDTHYYVMRDIGSSRVTIKTSVSGKPSSAKVEQVTIEYFFSGGEDESVDAHIAALKTHLRTRHRLDAERISVNRRSTINDIIR